MGKQRIRKKARRRIQKQNIPIVILSSITILLLFVWGGLYWRESTVKALVGPSDEVVYNWEELDELPTVGSKNAAATPVGGGQADAQQAKEDAGQLEATKQGQGAEQTEAIKQAEDAGQAEAAKQGTSTVKTEAPKQTNGPVTKVKEQSKAKPVTPKQTESSDITETNSSTSNQTDTIASMESKYEQELVQLKAKWMKDMDVILERAETSFSKLDKTNPIEVQAWQEQITTELSNAESACERSYLDVIQSAEKDSVSASKIDEWTLTYNALIVKLQDESRAKLQNLIGG